MKGVILLAALAATSGCSTNLVRPVEADPLPSRVVNFRDLDLQKSADAGALHDRIRRAAVQVCGGPVRMHDLSEFAIRSCIQHSIARAVSDVNGVRVAESGS